MLGNVVEVSGGEAHPPSCDRSGRSQIDEGKVRSLSEQNQDDSVCLDQGIRRKSDPTERAR